MKKVQYIIFFILVTIATGCGGKNKPNPEVIVESNTTVQETEKSSDIKEKNETKIIKSVVSENNTTIKLDENETLKTIADMNITKADEIKAQELVKSDRKLSSFEKSFVYHIGYNHYAKAIKLMYAKNHKDAYSEAMSAKNIYDANATQKEIVLPYLPGYVRESAQTPRRIYYKILVPKNYELYRLIRKIKLLNPPIPMVVLNQTSTYVDIEIKNYGDLPLDKFGIEINDEKVYQFPKINPNQSVTYRYNKSLSVEHIKFSEEFGFAPKDIIFENK